MEHNYGMGCQEGFESVLKKIYPNACNSSDISVLEMVAVAVPEYVPAHSVKTGRRYEELDKLMEAFRND